MRRYSECRTILKTHAHALNRKRVPWEISLYDAYARHLVLELERKPTIRFLDDVLDTLDPDTRQAIHADIETLQRVADLFLGQSKSPWRNMRVESQEDAAKLGKLAQTLAYRNLPPAVEATTALYARYGLSASRKLTELAGLLESAVEIVRLRTSLPEEFIGKDLKGLLHDLSPMGARGLGPWMALIFNKRYRAARALLKSHLAVGHWPI